MFEVTTRSYSSQTVRPAKDGLTIANRGAIRADSYYVMLMLGPALVAKTGWKEGQDVEVAWGSGSDLGKIRLRAAGRPSGFRLKKNARGNWSLSIGAAPEAAIKAESLRARQATIQTVVEGVDQTVYIVVPHAFRPSPVAAVVSAGG